MFQRGESSLFLPHSELPEIQFLETLKCSESSEIFRVSFRGLECCLKVFHINEDLGFADDGRDLCRYRCESQSYQALHAHGVCKQGIVPSLYGIFEAFDPELLGDDIASFKEDKEFPSAILLEYLPNAISFQSAGLSPELIRMAIEGLKKIHGAHVVHNDAYPKNVLVVPRTESHRVVWIDFDVSIVFPAEETTKGPLDWNFEVPLEMSFFESRVSKLPNCPEFPFDSHLPPVFHAK